MSVHFAYATAEITQHKSEVTAAPETEVTAASDIEVKKDLIWKSIVFELGPGSQIQDPAKNVDFLNDFNRSIIILGLGLKSLIQDPSKNAH